MCVSAQSSLRDLFLFFWFTQRLKRWAVIRLPSGALPNFSLHSSLRHDCARVLTRAKSRAFQIEFKVTPFKNDFRLSPYRLNW
jgi:hypothetical protein